MAKPQKPEYWTAPRLWPGATVVCIAGGPSLTREQVELVRQARFGEGRFAGGSEVGERPTVRVIVINSSVELAPWADALYACDTRWWDHHPEALAFPGLKVTLGPEVARAHPEVKLMERIFEPGLAPEPHRIRTGKNGGYQALGLAWHLAGPGRRILVAYDMRVVDGRTHWHGGHFFRRWQQDEAATFLPEYPALARELAARGVDTVNCTPGSALRCFPMGDLAEELAKR
jgi:hypothetical protein